MEKFEDLLYHLHVAYLHARRNKRNTANQLQFEMNQEANLHRLAKSVADRSYKPRPSLAFIVNKPVMREIFAADFSDRIIHHLIYRCIMPFVDRKLIHDTYSCRNGKGNLYGITRAKAFMRSCSQNFRVPVFVLKLDIEGYFMNMRHQIIDERVLALLPENQTVFCGVSKETVKYLLQETIFNEVTANCRIRGKRSDWSGLPASKSLFHSPAGVGLPIGNLTSQVFGNIYLNNLDHFIKQELKVKYYGRYVDDMLFIHQDKAFLIALIQPIQDMLDTIGLKLHPKKIVLKDVSEGVPFLGQILKPYRCFISNRTKKQFFQTISNINHLLRSHEAVSWEMVCDIRASINAYLGMLRHSHSFNLRKAFMNKLVGRFFDFFSVSINYDKVFLNNHFWEWHFTTTFRSTRPDMIS